MNLSNALIYNNRLECGSEDIALATLHLPNPSHLHTLTSHKEWLSTVLNPQAPVLFLNTDRCLAATEVSNGDQICNSFEASIVRQITHNLIEVS